MPSVVSTHGGDKPRGVWNSRTTKHRVEDITRVEAGGRYEQALLSVAGPAADHG